MSDFVGIHIAAEPDPDYRAEYQEKGSWFPDPPPMLFGETADQYTNRMLGVGDQETPFDHVRNRQCSLDFHEECTDNGISDPAARRCQCPHHDR